MTTAQQKKIQSKKKETTHPSSFRFRSHISRNLEYYSELLRRKKSSLVEEALEKYFEELERKKKEEEDFLQWKIEGVKAAKKEMEEGKGIDGDTVMKWFKSLGTDNPLPRPSSSQKWEK